MFISCKVDTIWNSWLTSSWLLNSIDFELRLNENADSWNLMCRFECGSPLFDYMKKYTCVSISTYCSMLEEAFFNSPTHSRINSFRSVLELNVMVSIHTYCQIARQNWFNSVPVVTPSESVLNSNRYKPILTQTVWRYVEQTMGGGAEKHLDFHNSLQSM